MPIAIGAGISGRNIYRDRNNLLDIFAKTNRGVASETQETVRNLLRGAASTSYQDIGARIKKLASEPGFSTLNPNQVLTAWKQAARAFPDASISGQVATALENSKTPFEILQGIQQGLGGGTSIHSHRVINKFVSNVRTLAGMDPGTAGAFGNFSTIDPIFRTGTTSTIHRMSDLSGLVRPGVAESMWGLKEGLGAGKMSLNVASQEGILGAMAEFRFTGGKLSKPLKLAFPLETEVPGVVVSGFGQRTQNIVGQFGIVENNKIVSTLNYEEWVALRARQDLLPQLKGLQERGAAAWEMDRLVRNFSDYIRRPFEYMAEGEANLLSRQVSASAMHLVTPEGEFVTGNALRGVIQNLYELGLWPSSPNRVIGGTLLQMNPAMFRMFPEAVRFSRRPIQAVRGFVPTVETARAIGRDPLSRQFSFAMGPGFAEDPTRTPAARTIYRTGVPGKQALGEGQLLISDRMRHLWRRRASEHIILGTQDVSEGLLGMLPGLEKKGVVRLSDAMDLPSTAVLGYTAEGEAVRAGKGARLLGARTLASGEIRLDIERVLPIEKFMHVFGDAKGMAEFIGHDQMRQVAGEGIDQIIHMDELKKNRDLLLKQQFTALVDFTRRNMNSMRSRVEIQADINDITRRIRNATDADLATHARMLNEQRRMLELEYAAADTRALTRFRQQFVDAPEVFSNQLRQRLGRRGTVDMFGVQEMSRLAKRLGITPEQAGRVFGAVPHAIGAPVSDELAALSGGERFGALRRVAQMRREFGFEKEWIPHILRGEAFGISHVYHAGIKETTGAGVARASIEPRIFDLMSAGQFGELTDPLKEHLLMRRGLSEPASVIAEQQLSRGLQSVATKMTAPEGATVYALDELSDELLNPRTAGSLFDEGGWVRGLPGMGDVFVPGADQTRPMAAYKTASGDLIHPDLVYDYARFLKSGRLGGTQFEEATSEFLEKLQKEHARTITGKEVGLARGKIKGSRFLTAVTEFGNVTDDIYRVGLSENNFGQMIEEMKDLADIQNMKKDAKRRYINQLDVMHKRFLAGEEVGGLMMRHPFIGKYSLAPVRYYRAEGIGEHVAVLPSVERTVKLKTAAGLETVTLDWSLAKGMAADYDADILGAMLLDPTMEKEVRSMAAAGTEFGRGYEQFALRTQLLKAKAAATEGISIADELKSAAEKMRITDEIGLLSFNLSKARASLLQQGITPQTEGALHLLEWLEQAPISAKHIPAGQEQALRGTISDIIGRINTGNITGLRQTITDIIDPKFMPLLEEGMEVIDEDLGRIAIPGINLDEALGTLQASMSAFTEKHGQEINNLKRWMMRTGRGRVKPHEVLEYLRGTGDIFDAVQSTVNHGVGSSVVSNTLSNINKLGKLGGRLAMHSKPLAFGFGASIAIAAALAEPLSTLSPNAAETPTPRFGNTMGDNVRAENVHPDSPAMGQPTPPNLLQPVPPPIEMGNPAMSARISVRGRSRGNFNAQDIGGSIRDTLGPRSRVNTRVYDDRRTLTGQDIADIIDR